MRIAAIDVGTNSVHLLVADIDAEGGTTLVEKAREQVELGADGGFSRNRIMPEAFDRGVETLTRYADVCRLLGVEVIEATATSAVREASNGADFCSAVRELTGIRIRTITGSEEGRLIYLGVRPELDFSRGRALVVDLGGGSTEIILCDAERPLLIESLPLGHIRLTDDLRSEPVLTADERRAIKRRVREVMEQAVGSRLRADDFAVMVGTSGAIRTLARMATIQRGEPEPEQSSGLVLRRPELDELLRLFGEVPRDQLVDLPGMDARRVATLPAAAVVVRTLMKDLGQAELVTSTSSLREGVLVNWMMKHRPELDLSRTEADPRRRSVLLTLERYGQEARVHVEHVAKLSLQLFDQLAPLHGLRIDDRQMLEYAALLHDIGHHISGRDHNKHGAYLLMNTAMPGFTAPELAVLSSIVRYHRGNKPKMAHRHFSALPQEDRRRVRRLSGILRLADALDRSHEQVIDGVDVTWDDQHVQIRATTGAQAHLERWAAISRRKLLGTTLGRDVRVELASPTGEAVESQGRDVTTGVW